MSGVRPIVLIVGPTAGGKTRLAIELAEALPGGGECVGADSMHVYRGMDVGTAKPTPDERARAPHHLLDLADPSDDGFTVDTWLERANRVIDEVRGRGRYPIVVGGTNLYVQALLAGLMDGPAPDPALRRKLEATDAAALRAWLERVDPAAAAQIHPNDRKRTVRAIEVFELSGRPISDLQVEWSAGAARDDVRIVGLDWPAEAINRRINRRVRAMIEAGLVDEVRRLLRAGPLGRQARAALGYRQILDHLEGRRGLDEAVEEIKVRTRRFAKQQRTWLRRFRCHPRSLFLPAAEISTQELVEKALAHIIRHPGSPAPEPRGAGGAPAPSAADP